MYGNNGLQCAYFADNGLQRAFLNRRFLNRVLLNFSPSTSTQLFPPPPTSFQPPHSSLRHPKRYENQNIPRNWAISPNLGQQCQNSPFCLKICAHFILEKLIPNPQLDFWHSERKFHFWANLSGKSIPCLRHTASFGFLF